MSAGFLKIAVITTAFTPSSHSDVIVRRWVDPHPRDADYGWTGARTKIASIYSLQRGESDLAEGICARYGILSCGSIDEALTLGTERLAVDAVMLIAEHGDFPENEFLQKLYPRKQMLDEVLSVMDRDGRTIPVFFDKHFSWSQSAARAMYMDLQRRRIPWFGGSSLSHCPQLPEPVGLEGEVFEEVVMTTWGDLESYLFHALEVTAALVEKRSGGETGIASVIAWRDELAWAALKRAEFSLDLLKAAVSSVGAEAVAAFDDWLALGSAPFEIFQLRYADGLKVTIVSQKNILRKWAFGVRLRGSEMPVSAAVIAGTAAEGYPHFARFSRRIEDFFLTGKSPVPGTRLYLTTMACAYCMQALARPDEELFCLVRCLPD